MGEYQMTKFKEGDKIRTNDICKMNKIKRTVERDSLGLFVRDDDYFCIDQTHWSLVKPKKNKYCCDCNSCIKNAIKGHPETHVHSYCGKHLKDRVFPKRVKKCKEPVAFRIWDNKHEYRCIKILGHKGKHESVIKW